MASSVLLWILILPFIGFLLNFILLPAAVGGMKNTRATLAGSLATLCIAGSFALSVYAFYHFTGTTIHYVGFNWLDFSEYKFDFGLELTKVSAIMILIITGIGSLIHLYSIGYMHKEVGAARFFAYLNLFCFSMLLLVLSDSLLFTFFGWEGVGLCSYLLIGYWYEHKDYMLNAKKAFVMNRIGDYGFLLGMFMLFYYFGSVNYTVMESKAALTGIPAAIAIPAALLLFVGATGKSAQIPLYTWLPDAMVGPTPVSALIHAATMVTAGVFLCAKMSFLFVSAPSIMTMIAVIGALTAILGAIIALGQTDIKKVLAYSTVSQLGFMFLAVGVGAFTVAIFHLMTHAFFKALLFLGAGSVIHGCEGEQDMRKMGGLRKKMPATYLTMVIGLFALSGIPLFAGFFSKDEILYFASRHAEYGWILIGAGLLASFFTAVYSGRMLKLTFFDHYRGQAHVHESPMTMLIPLLLLAALSTVGGFFGFSHELAQFTGLHFPNLIEHFFGSTLHFEFPAERIGELSVSALATAIALIGFFSGFKNASPTVEPNVTLANKLYVDEIYELMILKPIRFIQIISSNLFEKKIVDDIGTEIVKFVTFVGEKGRVVQKSGKVSTQVGFIFISVTVIALWFYL